MTVLSQTAALSHFDGVVETLHAEFCNKWGNPFVNVALVNVAPLNTVFVNVPS